MLISLHIENLAVIRSLDVDLSRGFMALTGETGAGKSIIIDGIGLLLGEKADRELIRTGETYAMVSGVFTDLTEEAIKALSENGVAPDEDGCILVQRNISCDGRSSVKINARAVTLTLLREIGPRLLNIHGQSDTSALSESKHQLEILDIYSGNAQLIADYSVAYEELEGIRREISKISEKEHERERLVEILRYQIDDIDSYALHDGEEEELVDRKLRIRNSEKLTKNAGFVFKALKGSEKGSVAFLLDRSASALDQISDVIPKFAEYSERLRDCLYQVEDIAEEVYAEISDMDEEPGDAINEIESRLDKISKLKRKYGLTIKDILAFRDNAEEELDSLQNSDLKLAKLEAAEKIAYEKAKSLADKLHESRTASAKIIEKEVKDILEFLDMPKVVFFADIKEEYKSGVKVLNPSGSDTVEFYISANRGADAQPLAKIASGGELARVMLALKSVIADKDGISTVIFDEIDAGVSGKTARKIGIKMLALSKNIQLISVTHSAQIASLADVHYLISKSDVNGATETGIKVLDREGRINELSRILGGIDVTDAQRRAAIDMLDEKKNYE